MRADEQRVPIDHIELDRDRATESFLHENIPISAAMGVRVKIATPERVELWIPWEPNANHHKTVFGGSAAAAATLAAWTLLQLRLDHVRANAQLVVQRSSVEYKKPITGDFKAVCAFDDREAWVRFERALARRGRGRLTLTARLIQQALEVGTFVGDFVALQRAGLMTHPAR